MSDRLKQWFAEQDQTPDAQAKSRALDVALNAFDEYHSGDVPKTDKVVTINSEQKKASIDQGLVTSDRPTSDNQPVGRRLMDATLSKIPTTASQRWLYSGLASAAMLVITVSLVMNIGPQVVDDALEGQPSPEQRLAMPDQADHDALAIEADAVTVRAARLDDRQAPELHSPAASRELLRASEERKVAALQQTQELQAIRVPKPVPSLANVHSAGGFSAELADALPQVPGYSEQGRDRFEHAESNPVKRVSQSPVSTFSIDVDTASYSFVRRQLNHGRLPQKDAVRLEEMVNYFPYDYPLPAHPGQPFSTTTTVLDSPWKAGNKLIHIGIKGYQLSAATQPRSNLVLLLDVSGSMNSPDKLPLVKQSMSMLLSRLQPEDTVSIVVYAGAAGIVLEPTQVQDRQTILSALNKLQAGGSTAGGEGIQLAYQLAENHFVKDGVNRIILATDGDFNVGIHNPEQLQGFVERKRQSGIYLSVLGFGQGNYHDQLMQALAQNGNGVAAYIDTVSEAQKVLVDEATSSLFPIASDVKIQVEFNPDSVSEYRLLGYETRMLAEEDFNNDAVDAGDIGAGHTVTALYEITPIGSDSGVYSASRYTQTDPPGANADEYGFLQLRYKLPGESKSRLISQPIQRDQRTEGTLKREADFATAVAGFAQLLQGGKYTGDWGYEDALKMALANRGDDVFGYRSELVQLMRKAEVANDL
ncbi:VWA domain-containing protein [Aestuariicella hydrocarbonica]|uniref:VWA domain-containing protein n=1 Tax=Pseudomaricurvus hydrocarbonicus TaxID=1470433 RepID=A0A9E5JSV3_9GAMM|nr:VWA domain-containing protein [Aestuariicella hydrocarbonica]NHO66168.1 VWA domain-containing protein [Aestuariicella hydrocarbonica]